MKKYFLLLMACCLALTMSAKVAYLLTATDKLASEVTDVYSYLPIEWYYNNGESDKLEASPERRAYEWFINSEGFGGDSYVTIKDVADGNLVKNGKPTVSAVWINVDRVGLSLGDFDNFFTNAVTEKLADYIKAGGNLFLTKQTTRLVAKMGRTDKYPSQYKNDGYETATDEWQMNIDFCTGGNVLNHAVYANLENGQIDDGQNHITRYPICSGTGSYYRTNNNAVWEGLTDGGCDENRRTTFENAISGKVLGGWGHTRGMDCAGMVEFYPTGDWKGTIIAIGLSAYQWGSQNASEYNVKNLTKGVLNYLDAPSMTWSTVPGDGILFEEKSAVLNDVAGRTWELSTDPKRAYIVGGNKVRYMAIASELPVTATVSAGDGISYSKTVYSITHNVVVGRDNAPTASLAYVLMNTNLNNLDSDEAGTYDPMYQSAEWFYNTYVKNGTGRFITYDEVKEGVPSTVKTLWLHIDRKFNDAADFTSNYAKEELYSKLAAYVQAGGNLYLSGFATYLAHSMSRFGTAPDDCGWASVYDVSADWHINLHCAGHMINGKTEGVENTSLFMVKGSNCTNRNCVWSSNKDAVNTDTYCKVLAGWRNGDGFHCAGMVEFYPKDDWKGTIIVNGLAACQWGTCNSDENARKSLQGMTSRTLTYLGKTLSFNWKTEPADGVISNTATVKIDHVAGNAVEFQVLNPNEDKASFGEITKENDGDYATLTYNKEGEGITIKAFGRGDGLNIPKNIEYSKQKDIKIFAPTVTWDKDPDNACVGEENKTAKATATAGTVQYSSSNTDIITVDNDGKMTFKAVGEADITAYVVVNGVTYSTEAKKATSGKPTVYWTTAPSVTKARKGDEVDAVAVLRFGPATVQYETENCTYTDGKVTFANLGTATIVPYVEYYGNKFYGEALQDYNGEKKTFAVSPDLKWETAPMSGCVAETGKKAVAKSETEGVTIQYTSSHPDAVVVDAEGDLTFKAHVAGKVTITATPYVNETAYEPITGELNANKPNVRWGADQVKTAWVGQTIDLTGNVEFGSAVVQYEITSGDATVSADGKKLKINGTSDVTIKPYVKPYETRYPLAEDDQLEITITVNTPALSWTHKPDNAIIGESKEPAKATCTPEATVKYKSSNEEVASIGETTGQITYKGVGNCTITAYTTVYDLPYEITFDITVGTNITTYERTVSPNKYGTICLERTSTKLEGGSFWQPEKLIKENDVVVGVQLVEVDKLKAGYGYFFWATASQIVVSMNLNEAALESPVVHNPSVGIYTHGMHGTFGDKLTIGVNDPNECVLYNNQLYYGTGNSVQDHRAYIKLSEVEDAPSTPAPGRRRVTMAVEHTNTTTGMENINDTDNANKMLIDGKIYILRGSRLYTTDGRLVK